jgi:hypothetical protein
MNCPRTRICMTLLLSCLLPEQSSYSAESQSDFNTIILPAQPTKVQVSSYLSSLESAIRLEFEHHFNVPYVGGQVRVRTPPKDVMRMLYGKCMVVPIEHLEVLCKAGAGAESPLFSQLIADSLGARLDYRPEDRVVVLKYLVRVPKLILVLDRLNWIDVKDPALLSAWRKVKQDTTGGMLDTVGYRFAALTARQGLLDALLSLANTVQLRAALPASSARDVKLKADGDVLRALVPSKLDAGELAAAILRQRNKLVFDPERRTFRLDS